MRTTIFDYLVAETARMHCRKLHNIHFLIPNAFSVNLDINGVGFNVSHGDDVRSNLGVPFYGMVRRQKGLIALGAMQGSPRTRYFCMGHHHTASSLGDVDGELIVNGAWVGTDSFAYNAFSGVQGAQPMTAWRQSEIRNHLASERETKTQGGEMWTETIPDRRWSRRGATFVRAIPLSAVEGQDNETH